MAYLKVLGKLEGGIWRLLDSCHSTFCEIDWRPIGTLLRQTFHPFLPRILRVLWLSLGSCSCESLFDCLLRLTEPILSLIMSTDWTSKVIVVRIIHLSRIICKSRRRAPSSKASRSEISWIILLLRSATYSCTHTQVLNLKWEWVSILSLGNPVGLLMSSYTHNIGHWINKVSVSRTSSLWLLIVFIVILVE